MVNPMSLANKKILVTGASSGIGRATAICCAQLGAQLVLLARDQTRLEETRSCLNGTGHQIAQIDFTEIIRGGVLQTLLDRVTADGGKLDGMVHCAGIPCVVPLKALTGERLHRTMSVNFYSFVELARQFIKKKYSNDGSSIVALSAALTACPREYELAYIASKAALEAAVPVIAMECGKRRIRVNCLAPGNVRTEMTERVIAENNNREFLDQAAERAILGWQQPEEIAKFCAFLLSDASSAITARTIRADGGFR